MTTPTYDQQEPSEGKLLNEDNEILDLQEFMESGAIIATAVGSATPVTPLGEATVPTYEQITPQAKKFINSLNEVYDLLAFLQSGNLKVQVIGGGGDAPSTATYITATDETALLPNSQPLGDLATGFMSVTTATGIVNSRVLTQTANQIDITNTDGLAGNPTFSLASVLITPGSLQAGTTFNVAGTVAIDAITNSSSSTSATAVMTASAVQAAIAAGVVSGKSLRGGWDASGGLYPATGGSGVAGAVAVGDWWYITVAGTLGTNPVEIGDHIVALVNAPGQTDANWFVVISKVDSVFGRLGPILAQAGDYSFPLISGTAAVAQGGTANTSVGAAGTFAYSDGAKYVFSGMTVPVTAGSAGTYWRSNGTNILSSTIQAGDVPTLNQSTTGQAGSVSNAATFNDGGTGDASGAAFDGAAAKTISYNTIGASPLAGSSSLTTVGTLTSGVWNATPIAASHGGPGYGVFVPFLANKVISGPDWGTVPFGTDTAKGICPGGASAAQFVYHYFLYLKVGVTYRFSFTALRFNSCGILQFAVKSADQSVTYNTLSNVDLYSAAAGVVSVNKQTFAFSPSGFNAGDWVECTFVYFCSSKNASSSSYFAPVIDGNAGFSFYEKYS